MAFNLQGAAELDLTVFGGLVTEMPAENLPAGTSGDNQDAIFRPGAVGKRPGLTKVFATPFGTTTLTYGKSYVDNKGVIRNLYLDALGNLWMENLTTASAPVVLATTTPGTYAKSITAFGREYIAISDALLGQEVPLQYDGTFLDRVTQDGPGTPPKIANLVISAVAMALSGGVTMTRTKNVVTVTTAAPHGLQVGYRAQITGVSAQPLGFITSITINNTDAPGVATIIDATPQNFASGQRIIVEQVQAATVGNIFSLSRQGGIVTVVLTAPMTLSAGAIVTLSGVGDATFNTTYTVSQITGLASFIALQADADAVVGAGGTVNINWPELNSEGSIFEILSVPAADTFQIPINYADGVWPSGDLKAPWDGTFYVQSVPTATSFTYIDYGVDGTSTDIGKVTPQGQVAPGLHQMQVMYKTRQGYVTAPSPPLLFQANGAQYLHVTDIPIGPSNVEARILAFTGAGGAYFFYVPVQAQVNGQIVSTATQINDNTTTAVTLDFSDNTLFAALGINIPGNNLPAQIVLDSAIGFGFYSSRLLAYGQRNRVLNLLNMGFDGGALPSTPTIPTGWTGSGGHLATGHYGSGWQITGAGSLTQSFYEDAYGAPIATGDTQYRMRAWVKGVGSTATLTISSASTAFTATATVTGTSATGSWLEAAFSAKTPVNIPSDMLLGLSGTGVALIDELSVIYSENPNLPKIMYGSYDNNPEGFDGVTGKFGPEEDTHKIMDFDIIRSTLFILTQDPGGRIHSITANGVTEPVGWTVNEVGANCGALSIFSVTKSQADDSSAAGGEEWMAWASSSGARIFGGNQPWKISQEIQPDWDNINPAAVKAIWALNDPVTRRIYYGLPMATATAPSLIYPVDYRELDTAEQIDAGAPIHTSYSGRLIATDHVRKWTRWNLTINGASLMYRQPGQLTPVFFYGNGAFPNTVSGGCGNVYVLCSNKLTDDCFGQINFYYVTYFFANHDAEQALQITWGRHMLQYFAYEVAGYAGLNNGHVKVTAFVNQLDNPWPLLTQRNIRVNPAYDDEWPGGNVTGQRIAFKFESLPGTV